MYQDGDLFRDLFRPGAPIEMAGDVQAMTFALDHAGWAPAASFARLKGWSDRKCRAIAQASKGRIISGNQGYKLTTQCTPEEFNEANGRLRSQARKMLRRAIQQARVFHKRGM